MQKVTTCQVCDGTGINILKASRQIKLCDCIEKSCECGGKAPFYVVAKGYCKCRKYRIKIMHINKNIFAANIPKKFQWKFINDIKMEDTYGNPTAIGEKFHYFTCMLEDSYYENLRRKNGFYIFGKSKTGKTLLACALLNEIALYKRKRVFYISLKNDFMQRLRNQFCQDPDNIGNNYPIVEALAKYDVVMLDDFGSKRYSDWEQKFLYMLIDNRYLGERITMFVSHKYLEDLGYIAGGRVSSRLIEMCNILKFDGHDYLKQFK